MSFLFGLLFFILLFILFIGGVVLLGAMRIVTGIFDRLFGKKVRKGTSASNGWQGDRVSGATGRGASTVSRAQQPGGKIIDPGEGEYVDYEEIE